MRKLLSSAFLRSSYPPSALSAPAKGGFVLVSFGGYYRVSSNNIGLHIFCKAMNNEPVPSEFSRNNHTPSAAFACSRNGYAFFVQVGSQGISRQTSFHHLQSINELCI